MAASRPVNRDLYGFFMNRKLSSGHQEQSRTSKSASSECRDEAPSVKAVAYGFLIRPLRNLYGAFDRMRYVATDLRQADALATAFSGRQLFLSEDDRQARRERDHDVELTKTLRSKNVTVIRCSWVLALSLFGTAGYSQAQSGHPTPPVNLAQLDEPGPNASDADSGGNTTSVAGQPPAASAPASSADIARELAMMKLRIQQLEAQLQQRTAAEHPAMADEVSTAPEAAPDSAPARKTILGFYSPSSRPQNESTAQGAAPATQQESWAPFAYADWT